MRKNTIFYETKTLEIKSYLLHLSFGFYTLLHCNLELVVKGRMYPCIGIVILLNSRKYYMLVPVPVSVVPVPIFYWCFSVWGYRYRLEQYRYRLATVEFLLRGTDTDLTGTGTTTSYLFPSIIALPETSPQLLPSSSMIHIRFLDMNPCNN